MEGPQKNADTPATHAPPPDSGIAWYCVRTQPKHEHIAAAHLQQTLGTDVFCPRFRTKRSTRRGPVWFTESLFPNYLFARFDLGAMLNQVKYTPGVSTVVHFGHRTPTLDDREIEALRASLLHEDLLEPVEEFAQGEDVTLANDAFYGYPAKVLQRMSTKGRIKVLMEIMGRETTIEVAEDHVISNARRRILRRCAE